MASIELPVDYKSSHVEKTSAAISDQLFRQMCRSKKKATIFADTNKVREINFFYAEAATYVRRLTFGKFDNGAARPIFHLDCSGLSEQLKADLIERVKTGKEAIHRVVEDSVYRLLRAHFELMFYEHIEPKRLNWRFV
ncbi:MAG: hypothetical protein DLM72_01980 [Candidatus Nitrosopolaris wilkensis]|nr:MAG: hypothetical protein DLM72_01980 [Candidatus Nitrosopolaris wilkensis]